LPVSRAIQEKCEAVFRPELRKNKGIDRFRETIQSWSEEDSMMSLTGRTAAFGG